MTRKHLVLALVSIALAGVAAVLWVQSKPEPRQTTRALTQTSDDAIVQISLPLQYSDAAKDGQAVFEANCAACHGRFGVGREGLGPPLIHRIYEPSHHGDAAFQRAVAQGVRPHHWRFGAMPPVQGVSSEDVVDIIAWVRETQQANGIR